MNFTRYCIIYSRFHGCKEFRNHGDSLIILDLLDQPIESWSTLYLEKLKVHIRQPKQPLVQALKIFFKSEEPTTVFYRQDMWALLIGNTKEITPTKSESANVHLYATPYFVQSPSVVANYLSEIARPAAETAFLYKNCILYLDNYDIPYPGGSYFKSTVNSAYRICFLSSEPAENVAPVALEWKDRKGVSHVPFSTKTANVEPKFLSVLTMSMPHLSESRATTNGRIYKDKSEKNPERILHDILTHYHDHYSEHAMQNVGLVVEWPIRLQYEGTLVSPIQNRQFAFLSINGSLPTRTVLVRYPYEIFTEYSNEVPAAAWTPLHYVRKSLIFPPEAEKVSINSIVIGFIYENAFFCFSQPIIEGKVDGQIKNMSRIVNTLPSLPANVRKLETYQHDAHFLLHRVGVEGVPYPAWCLVESKETRHFTQASRLPALVNEWLQFFNAHFARRNEQPIHSNALSLALILAQHKICFQTKIEEELNRQAISISGNDIELRLGKEEADFINNFRVSEPKVEEKKDECSIM